MFYASVARPAPFFELRVKPGDCVALSRWRFREKIWVNNVGYTAEVFGRQQAKRNFRPWWDTVHMTPANRLVHEFFAAEFARDVRLDAEHEYKLGIAISEKLMGPITTIEMKDPPLGTNVGGLVYPSLAMFANADNVVLTPEVVSKCLEFEQVEFHRIHANPEPLVYRTSLLDFANSASPGGIIEWKGRLPRWQLDPGEVMIFVVEHGRFVAYDAQGKRIESD